MMYVPECLWLLLLISGTCFRYWTSAAIYLKMTDMNPLIILIGPFLVYKKLRPDLAWGTKKWAPWLLQKDVTFNALCSHLWVGDQFHNQGRESTGTGRDRLPVGVFSIRSSDRVTFLLTDITRCCISRGNIFLGLQLFKMPCAYIHINSHFISLELSGFY